MALPVHLIISAIGAAPTESTLTGHAVGVVTPPTALASRSKRSEKSAFDTFSATVTIQPRIPSPINRTHPALANSGFDDVWPHRLARVHGSIEDTALSDTGDWMWRS